MEKLAETDLGGAGQRVMSVNSATEWNLAREMTVEALLGPEWRIMSGLTLLMMDAGSLWIVT